MLPVYDRMLEESLETGNSGRDSSLWLPVVWKEVFVVLWRTY